MNRLPSEIISHIARCLPDEDTIDTEPIVPLTHICRYWRESIISTPGNWTRISSESESLTVSSLQRAKLAPLQIHLDIAQIMENPGFSVLITPHIQNSETLDIDSISTVDEFKQVFPNFPQLMPNLRSLSLTGYGGWDGSVDPFGSLLPTLTQLSLIEISLYPSLLRLRTLTHLTLRYNLFDLHLDTLLDFLEENRSLEHATLDIRFVEPSLRSSRRRAAIKTRLQSLTMASYSVDSSALTSNIALHQGAHLGISLFDNNKGLNDLLSVTSMTHLSNLQSPTLMEYNPDHSTIRLLGPNGSFLFDATGLEDLLTRSPPPHLANVRNFYLIRPTSVHIPIPQVHIVFPPSFLPSLEMLAIDGEATVLLLFSEFFSNPSSPSLKILAFLDCDINEGFMEELTRFASDRKKTTSAWLYRVVIVNSKGILPRIASIDALRKLVPVVDVQVGTKLPADLM